MTSCFYRNNIWFFSERKEGWEKHIFFSPLLRTKHLLCIPETRQKVPEQWNSSCPSLVPRLQPVSKVQSALMGQLPITSSPLFCVRHWVATCGSGTWFLQVSYCRNVVKEATYLRASEGAAGWGQESYPALLHPSSAPLPGTILLSYLKLK